jgi:hypothetical protein
MGMTFSAVDMSANDKWALPPWRVEAKCDCCGATTRRGEFYYESEAKMFAEVLGQKEAATKGVRHG